MAAVRRARTDREAPTEGDHSPVEEFGITPVSNTRNTYQLQAFMRGSNLHALWDSGIIKNINEDVDSMTARLL